MKPPAPVVAACRPLLVSCRLLRAAGAARGGEGEGAGEVRAAKVPQLVPLSFAEGGLPM